MIKYLNKYIPLIILVVITIGCSSPSTAISDYGTESDSARYYFQKGWEEILDNGRWTESEKAFRKAVEFDPNWALGKSLVGRITRNLEERIRLVDEIEALKASTSEEEWSLVEVNLLSMKATNSRARGLPISAKGAAMRREIAEKNFGAFIRKYPSDDYFKAEYIEFLHATHGAEVALDSLHELALPRQMDLGFYISYQATLELELGDTEKAKSLLKELKSKHGDPSYTSAMMLEAQIWRVQDSLLKARAIVDRVVEMDSNHLIARGMQIRLDQMIRQQ